MKPEFLSEIALSMNMVGSRYTCNPPPTETDEDWLVLINEKDYNRVLCVLNEQGFDLDNPNGHYRPENSAFNSWRGPENLNIILTSDVGFHNRFLAATSLAKRYNLLDRSERVLLFQTVLYGSIFDPIQFIQKPKDWY